MRLDPQRERTRLCKHTLHPRTRRVGNAVVRCAFKASGTTVVSLLLTVGGLLDRKGLGGLIQVCNEVLELLDPDGDPQPASLHLSEQAPPPVGLGDAQVVGDGAERALDALAMLHEALDASQGGGALEHLPRDQTPPPPP